MNSPDSLILSRQSKNLTARISSGTPATMDEKDPHGPKNDKGHIGFCGHGDYIESRNIRTKPLTK